MNLKRLLFNKYRITGKFLAYLGKARGTITKNKKGKDAIKIDLPLKGCPTRIRTSTDRIKICCTTLILWDKRSAKVRRWPLFSKHEAKILKRLRHFVALFLNIMATAQAPF